MDLRLAKGMPLLSAIIFIARKWGEDFGYIIGYQGSGKWTWHSLLMEDLADEAVHCAKLENKAVEQGERQTITDPYKPI